MLGLFISNALVSFANLGVALAVCLAAHGKIHANLCALTHKVCTQIFHDILFYALGNADPMLVSPCHFACDLIELFTGRLADGAELRRFFSLVNITANAANKLLHDS